MKEKVSHIAKPETDLLILLLEEVRGMRSEINELKNENRHLKHMLKPVFNFFNEDREPLIKRNLTKKEELELSIQQQEKMIYIASLQDLMQ